MRDKIFKYAIAVCYMSCPTLSVQASAVLDFSHYLQVLSTQSPEALDKAIKVKQAQLRLDESKALYSSELSGSFSKNRITEGALDLQSTSYNLNWNQTFSTGTTLSSRINKEGFGALNQSTQSITLSQSIWRNAFGRQSSLSERYAKDALILSEKEKKSFKLRFCLQTAQSYGNLLSAQEQVIRSRKRLDDAKRVFHRFQSLFQQNLIRKIDYFNAKDNFLQAEKEYEDRVAMFNAEIISLKPLVDKPFTKIKDFPSRKDSVNESIDIQNHPYSQEAKQRVEVAEQGLISQKNTESFDLRLFVSGQKATSEIKDDQSATAYGISLDYTLADPQSRRRIEEATLTLAQARALKNQTITSLTQELARTKALIHKLEININSNKERLKNAADRLSEASRLLDTVQLEITDYINFQQQMRSIEDQIQNDQIELYLKSLEYEVLKGLVPSICQEIL